ncbi:transcription-repair coupling factor, partial [bacterium]|nr:transcription-repair coupling factor [bacterium]
NTLIVLDEPAELEKKLCQLRQFTENAADYFLADSELYAFIEQFAHCSVSTSSQTAEPFFKDPYPVLFGITPPSFLTQLRDGNKKTPELIEHTLKEISYLLHDNYSVTLSFNNEGERERFNEICMDKRIDSLTRCPSVIGSISGGFICPELSYAFLSDQEIFGRTPVRRSRKKFKYSAPLYTVFDIQIGDYVVHAQYGIGRYQGIQHILHDGKQQEMMVIEYANKGVLYVPLIHSNLVRRYIGCGAGETPKLDVLGSNSWMRKRKSVEEAVFDLAAEFLDIQAARKTLSGTQFKPDTPWEREFEAAFIYEETADQLSAIHSVKSDMESTRPMDRLICGDVGYGKTEVAIRAAFKAVMNGKQVAILVPTTILAQQHYKVFSERMADYPVNVEMLSRFRTNAQQRDIIKAANAGSIDILIGTHRLIQHDVRFKDLGLVIIDEEQRFGVRHKEQLKRMRRMVDVLTMTATPIPRTLYLALVGARDMSTINTPPEDRLPVHTYVTSYDDTVIQQAIQREMNREGQVFFVHNRVKSIEKIQNKLQKIVPEARFGIAHGQMHEKELSAIMDLFRAGEIDVLVCTTIIESGLDIPNANTIIIDRADLIGLADLYQLRGRVGRFKHRAYAYMLVPAYKITSEQASKRLDAIETHQDLGAGFQIAMRDLEIRGAGNIIGEQQHGHISAVGFDLYCKLLKNAIAQLKGETIPQPPDVQVKLGFDAIIPSSYIASENQRLAIYSRLQEITNISQIDELHKELDDIYGDPPVPVEVLLDVVRIKLLAAEKRISSVEVKENKLLIKQNEFFLTDSSQKHYRIRHNSELEVTNSIKTILKELSSYDII